MKHLLLLALLVVALSHHVVVSSQDDDEQWELFKLEHMKIYNSEEEQQQRKMIFLEKLKFVREHNAKYQRGEVTFDVGINHLSDLTMEEYEAMNGFKYPENEPRSGKEFDIDDNVDLPETVDWRLKGAVTEIKDQGNCGSCWAFSTTGSLEGQHFLMTNKLVSLSEQNLIDCAGKEGNYGCSGGFVDDAFQYILNNKGIDTEKTYPYAGRDGKCRYNKQNKGASISGFVDIPSGSEKKLQAAVASKGPISVAIDASHMSFQLYSGGIYNEPQCSNIKADLDHAVLLVGYGTTPKGEPYWLVKNSWGTSWGLEGYMMMPRNHNNMCGIATLASYPTIGNK